MIIPKQQTRETHLLHSTVDFLNKMVGPGNGFHQKMKRMDIG
jgi:hypothetical protein